MFRIILLSTLLATGACVLGDQATPVSPYESAYFESTEASGVGDGLSPLTVRIHGDPGATLTLQVSGAEFLGSPNEEGQVAERLAEKTVQLVDLDDEGQGVSEVQLVSQTPGLAHLAFKLAPLAATLELEFLPVQVEIDVPSPVELRPGQVVHEICLYANTARGTLHATASSGTIFPERVVLEAVSESTCAGNPSALGAALVQWKSSEAEARLEVAYIALSGESIPASSRELDGEVFPGYQATLHNVEVVDDWASVRTELSYRATDSLPSKMAASVPLQDLRSIPAGLKLVGSSSGSPDTLPETDSAGVVTLYFEVPENSPPVSVFATPLGGGTTYLGEIGAP